MQAVAGLFNAISRYSTHLLENSPRVYSPFWYTYDGNASSFDFCSLLHACALFSFDFWFFFFFLVFESLRSYYFLASFKVVCPYQAKTPWNVSLNAINWTTIANLYYLITAQSYYCWVAIRKFFWFNEIQLFSFLASPFHNDMHACKHSHGWVPMLMNWMCFFQAWDLYYHVFKRIDKQLQTLTTLDLQASHLFMHLPTFEGEFQSLYVSNVRR